MSRCIGIIFDLERAMNDLRLGILSLCVVMLACSPAASVQQDKALQEQALKKITFDLDEIDENGLIGPPDGKRAVAYEFCIPIDKRKRKEVLSIDPSIRFFDGPSGRVGCDTGQYLCLGDGATRDVLLKLASLEYIEKIVPFYGE